MAYQAVSQQITSHQAVPNSFGTNNDIDGDGIVVVTRNPLDFKQWIVANRLAKLYPYFVKKSIGFRPLEMDDLLTLSKAMIDEMWKEDAMKRLHLPAIYRQRFKRAVKRLQTKHSTNATEPEQEQSESKVESVTASVKQWCQEQGCMDEHYELPVVDRTEELSDDEQLDQVEGPVDVEFVEQPDWDGYEIETERTPTVRAGLETVDERSEFDSWDSD